MCSPFAAFLEGTFFFFLKCRQPHGRVCVQGSTTGRRSEQELVAPGCSFRQGCQQGGWDSVGCVGCFSSEKSSRVHFNFILIFFSQTCDRISPHFALPWKRPGKIISAKTRLSARQQTCLPDSGALRGGCLSPPLLQVLRKQGTAWGCQTLPVCIFYGCNTAQ